MAVRGVWDLPFPGALVENFFQNSSTRFWGGILALAFWEEDEEGRVTGSSAMTVLPAPPPATEPEDTDMFIYLS